jgi:hypothetical protein
MDRHECRRVAARYDKLAANDLAFVKLASIRYAPMSPRSVLLCDLLMASAGAAAACFLKRAAPRRRAGLRVARTGEEFVDCDHRGASDDGDGRHHENGFDHGFP